MLHCMPCDKNGQSKVQMETRGKQSNNKSYATVLCEEGMGSSNFFLHSKYRVLHNTGPLVIHNIFFLPSITCFLAFI